MELGSSWWCPAVAQEERAETDVPPGHEEKLPLQGNRCSGMLKMLWSLLPGDIQTCWDKSSAPCSWNSPAASCPAMRLVASPEVVHGMQNSWYTPKSSVQLPLHCPALTQTLSHHLLSFPSTLKTLKKSHIMALGFLSNKTFYFYCWNFYCILYYKSLNPHGVPQHFTIPLSSQP